MPDKAVEGSQDDKDLEGKESVPMTRYIGVKEMLRKRETELATVTEQVSKIPQLEADVKNLGEQIKQAKESEVDPEKLKTLEKERDEAKIELNTIKRNEICNAAGVKPDDVKDKSDAELKIYLDGLKAGQGKKPGADGGGGGGGSPPTSSMDKMKSGWDNARPSDK